MHFSEIVGQKFYSDSSTTVTFKCDPPLLFHPFSGDNAPLPGSRRQFLRFSHVTVCAFRKSEEFPYGRTVMHASEQLKGGDGFCYGALADALVMDGHEDAWTALQAFGYAAQEAECAA